MNGNVADLIAAYLTGERWMAKDTSQRRPAREAVARLAYHLYEVRGRQDGHDLDDWLRAEDQLARGGLVLRVISSLHIDHREDSLGDTRHWGGPHAPRPSATTRPTAPAPDAVGR